MLVLVNKSGRPDGIAFVGQFLGSLLAAGGHPQARDVLQSSKEAFLRLGMTADANGDELIQQLPPSDSSDPGTGASSGPTGRQNPAQGI